MVFPASGLALLGLGASLVNAIPQANHIIARPPATLTVTSLIEITNEVTVTACGSNCATAGTVTVTETQPCFYTCSASASSSVPGTWTSTPSLPTISIPPKPSVPTSYVNSTTGIPTSSTPLGTGSSTSPTSVSPPDTSSPGTTVSTQLPSLTTSHRSPANTTTRTRTKTIKTRTLTLSTGISLTTGTGTGASSVPYPSSSLWSNTTRPIPSTTPGSLTTTEATLSTIPIPTPSDVDTTSAPCTTYGCPSYTTATYTTVINTTVSDQLPETGTASQSKTTLRSTIIVTVTKSLPSSTGTGYSSTSPGTGISTGFPSHTIPTSSIKLSSTLSYPTTTSSSWTNTTTTSSGTSTETTSDDVITSTQSPSSTKKPCTTHKAESSTESIIESSTQSNAKPSLVTPTTMKTRTSDEATASSSTSIYGGYDFGHKRRVIRH
ncbi:hypothetical protein K4K53_009601 [Colletotrichum sp. SAR 10_77]|nr:hypothetical protein K4K53_009601 [Colletotrichum sp. SAR 10_77]